MPQRISNVTPSSAGACVVCGKGFQIGLKSGPKAPVPYTKNNKTGYAHAQCVKTDKPNDPAHNDPGNRTK